MYKRFFGLRERPFKLVPNPAYLFLSQSHEEALAHLKYALSQGDGFALITGEVGTGKTTLCRAFLDSLEENIEAAYIFNPKLDSLQLLKAINDEFDIDSVADNTKALIDTLNVFLMGKKAAGRKAILLIDEAQNLSKPVLEQLRLLSNLETNTDKLIQIILVGQPELADMLETYELRQLGQRISLSCHLQPLTYKETAAYIQHRIHIAADQAAVAFSQSALRVLHRFTGGVPRLVNIACDRALLTAFGLSQRHITGALARSAVKELSIGKSSGRGIWLTRRKSLLTVSAIAMVAILGLSFKFFYHKDGRIADEMRAAVYPLSQTALPPEPNAIDSKKTPLSIGSAENQSSKQMVDLASILSNPKPGETRRTALDTVLRLWLPDADIHQPYEEILADKEYFSIAAKQHGLMLYTLGCNLATARRLNLPAIVVLRNTERADLTYLVLIRTKDDDLAFKGKSQDWVIFASSEMVEDRCADALYILWKDFYAFDGVVSRDSKPDAILALKMLLSKAGYRRIGISGAFDAATESTIRDIQSRHDIPVDGLVGPLTKIILYNQVVSLRMPRLADSLN